MPFRMMEYYAALVSKFLIKENGYNKYGPKEMKIPEAEFHIVYNGLRETPKDVDNTVGKKIETVSIYTVLFCTF